MLPVMMLGTKLTKLSVPIVEISIVRPYSSALTTRHRQRYNKKYLDYTNKI